MSTKPTPLEKFVQDLYNKWLEEPGPSGHIAFGPFVARRVAEECAKIALPCINPGEATYRIRQKFGLEDK